MKTALLALFDTSITLGSVFEATWSFTFRRKCQEKLYGKQKDKGLWHLKYIFLLYLLTE